MPELAQASEQELVDEILRLKGQQGAVILAHNYQIPPIQDLADFVGDSLGLSRTAAKAETDLIVFCGVHFMAETAAILCPEKRVLIPDLGAGCSLAATITGDDVRKWKTEHPDAVVVSYVNTTADVKAESDYCCTSTNALKVVNSIPSDREILFLPDMFLGAYVASQTKRKVHIWPGECHVHAGMTPEIVNSVRENNPNAEFLIHPECGCVSSYLYFLSGHDISPKDTFVYSTEGMIRHARQSPAKKFVVATETGILHRMRKENPGKEFLPVKEDAVCKYMKMITLEKLYVSLRDLIYDVRVPEHIASKARLAIERMLQVT